MKTEFHVKQRIVEVTKANLDALNSWPTSLQTNSVLALKQMAALKRLGELFWVLGETRPRYKCDDYTKTDD